MQAVPRRANVVPRDAAPGRISPEPTGGKMGLRDRREERREERRDERQTFGRRGDAAHFQMRQKMLSIGDDYWIENDAGERVFKVDGKALRLRNTLDLEDRD